MFEGSNNNQAMNFGGQTQGGVSGGSANGYSQSSNGLASNEPVVKELKNLSSFFQAMESCDAAIVDFFSYNCGPCVQIKPFFEQLAKDYQIRCANIKFFSVNVDTARDIGQ